MKPIRFSLVDMDQDLTPELIIEGSIDVAGFVLVIRQVDGEMIAHEFSHRQMYDLKKIKETLTDEDEFWLFWGSL